jgi:hypothetical protein
LIVKSKLYYINTRTKTVLFKQSPHRRQNERNYDSKSGSYIKKR